MTTGNKSENPLKISAQTTLFVAIAATSFLYHFANGGAFHWQSALDYLHVIPYWIVAMPLAALTVVHFTQPPQSKLWRLIRTPFLGLLFAMPLMNLYGIIIMMMLGDDPRGAGSLIAVSLWFGLMGVFSLSLDIGAALALLHDTRIQPDEG